MVLDWNDKSKNIGIKYRRDKK